MRRFARAPMGELYVRRYRRRGNVVYTLAVRAAQAHDGAWHFSPHGKTRFAKLVTLAEARSRMNESAVSDLHR